MFTNECSNIPLMSLRSSDGVHGYNPHLVFQVVREKYHGNDNDKLHTLSNDAASR